MIALIATGLIILLLYMIRMVIYNFNWQKHPVFETGKSDPPCPVSIVIAFRNEQENLPDLLHSLALQQYPATLWEVIFVDDHSSDGSAELIRDFISTRPGFRYLSGERGITGKKSALHRGIHEARHEFIVTTDADCTMGNQWLATICNMYSRLNPDMIIGLVDTSGGPGFFDRFQEIEFLSLVAAGAASAAGGKPIYCNAANLAFKRELFLSHSDPLRNAVPSGDDTLFMHRIKKNRNNRVLLLKSAATIVNAGSVKNTREFLNQRIRWASKSRFYTDAETIFTASLVLGLSGVIVASLVILAAGIYPWLFPALLAGKSVTDCILLKGFLRFYNKDLSVLQLIAFELIYPFYILTAFIGGLLNLYSWKERSYKHVRSRA